MSKPPRGPKRKLPSEATPRSPGARPAGASPDYAVAILPAALRSLEGIPAADQARIRAKIDALAGNPRPAGVKLLQGTPRRWRVRSGDFRVIYRVDDGARTVLIVEAGPRRDAYRRRRR